MATGTFPVGLQARTLRREVKYLKDLQLSRVNYKESIDLDDKLYHETLNIDGGVLDNEPFQLMEEVLGMDEKDKNTETFDKTVLMIDPFPSVGKPEKLQENSLIPNVLSLLNVLVTQSGIQPQTLAQLSQQQGKKNNLDPFMISPVRYEKKNNIETKVEGGKALACGAVSGFSGFLHKEFRIHDYFMGREPIAKSSCAIISPFPPTQPTAFLPKATST